VGEVPAKNCLAGGGPSDPSLLKMGVVDGRLCVYRPAGAMRRARLRDEVRRRIGLGRRLAEPAEGVRAGAVHLQHFIIYSYGGDP